ncbi:MAG: leucine-rich repeat domain-containing protein, partial [Muribaculaceae bacterium]|nr:leucine-rich repeat domain-containing protein [Muribaculaceae bacterium]
SVTIPESVTSIGVYAFMGCSRLTAVAIPSSVTEIGYAAFCRCYDLTEVYYGAENPIEIGYDIFSDYSKPTLYVPEVAVEKCKQISPWMYFSKIEAYNFAGIDEITVDIDSEKSYEVYNLNGIALGNSTDNLTKGIYIIRQGSTVKKITVK